MVKVIAHVTKLIIATITAILFSSCVFNKSDDNLIFSSTEGSGNVVSQNRPVSENFDYISASTGLKVVIEQDNKASITVEADDNLQELIKTEIKGKQLEIFIDGNIKNATKLKVKVRTPNIKGIETSSSAKVISLNTIRSRNISLSASSASSLEVAIDAENASCETSSAAKITVRGKTIQLDTDSSSSSRINAKGLIAKHVVADASSASNTTINPQESLHAEASSASSIKYINTPAQLSKDASSGGSVKKSE
ncbi:MAG: hypothetical protein BM557_10020 [Flavobacterium sp. MedPE-SWcel]|uniref:head GIN domain-containing protein n=1 Tax=uncultured Flavobacterium sp. TaxID=165435 RepID=UPI0009153E34|nr:head GIN domain-containing protein [uncultured Flavobacterium sp.]OIQ16199.1 MAG: hypothetical protein BM557_10020 [Flavobacterium sp. MedPE-SWcel]